MSDIRFVQDADGGIVLDIEHDLFFSLNPTAARIWELLARGKCSDEIARKISIDNEISLELALADTREFMAELSAQGLNPLGTVHRSCHDSK